MIQDQSSITTLLYDHKIESISLISECFHAQNGKSYVSLSLSLSLSQNRTYSQTIMKFNKLIFQSISWFHLT